MPVIFVPNIETVEPLRRGVGISEAFPYKLLLFSKFKFKTANLERLAIDDGILPDKLFEHRERVERLGILPIASGIVPFN